MTREKAIKIVKEFINGTCLHLADQEALESLIPELRESEDERIRKIIRLALIASEDELSDFYKVHNIHRKECTDWLEKQKEQPTNEEMLRTLRTEYEKGVADTIAKYEQKEQKHSLNFDAISSWLRDHASKYVNGEFNEFHHCVEYDGTINVEKLIADLKLAVDGGAFDVYEQKARRPNIELIQRSWYREGYNDREFGKEPKWVIKTGDGGPKYEENPKYGQMLEAEQKPEEKPINWTELTWEDINELEDIINKVHYEFRNGIGQESFGKEVLEQFREYKGDEYLDEIEQKPVEMDEDIELGLDRALMIVKDAKGVLPGYQSDDGIYECDHAIRTLTYILKNGIELKPFNVCEQCPYYKDCPDYNEQKPAEWNEEDEELAEELIKLAEYYTDTEDETEFKPHISWLKALPERFNLQPKQEWSEEDEHRRTDAIYFLESAKSHYADTSEIEKTIVWLKSLPLKLKKKNEDVAKLCSNEWSEEDERKLQKCIKIVERWEEDYDIAYAPYSGMLKSLHPSWEPGEE